MTQMCHQFAVIVIVIIIVFIIIAFIIIFVDIIMIAIIINICYFTLVRASLFVLTAIIIDIGILIATINVNVNHRRHGNWGRTGDTNVSPVPPELVTQMCHQFRRCTFETIAEAAAGAAFAALTTL